MVKSKENLLGAWAFLIGIIFAIIIGLVQHFVGGMYNNLPYGFLVLLGIMVGIFNPGDDSMKFLLASLSLVIVSGLGQAPIIFISNLNPFLSSLNSILSALLIMMIPATIIVALKTVFSITNV